MKERKFEEPEIEVIVLSDEDILTGDSNDIVMDEENVPLN